MYKIGLTGGIGSGKTTLARMFELLQIPIYYSDTRAKLLMVNHQGLKTDLINLLGNDVYLLSGQINKSYISSLIFQDNTLLSKVNSIVHPIVDKDFLEFCRKYQSVSYIIKESAILFETGLYKRLDKTILVTASETDRIERVKARDITDSNSIKDRISKQWKDSDKIKLADFIIKNNNQNFVIPQILKIHKQITIN